MGGGGEASNPRKCPDNSISCNQAYPPPDISVYVVYTV